MILSETERPDKAYYTPDELFRLRILPLGRTGIYRGLKEGSIPAIRIGKKFIIPKAALSKWLQSAGGAAS